MVTAIALCALGALALSLATLLRRDHVPAPAE
jgi:hypothetical protein